MAKVKTFTITLDGKPIFVGIVGEKESTDYLKEKVAANENLLKLCKNFNDLKQKVDKLENRIKVLEGTED